MEQVKTLSKKQIYQLLASLFIALFWVIFLWNFWDKGIYAFGINSSVFLLLVFLFWGKSIKEHSIFGKDNLFWIIPISLIILGYAIYENPFLKAVNIFVLPAVFTIAFNYALLTDRKKVCWYLNFFFRLFFTRFFGSLAKLPESGMRHNRLLHRSNQKKGVIKQVAIGLVLLFIIAGFFVIPLLSSADPAFASSISWLSDWITGLVSMELAAKIVVTYVWSLFLLAVYLVWKKPLESKDDKIDTKVDSIVSGIVIGGILLLYLLFLVIQLGHLWVAVLPVDFGQTEALVKSGFWQLMLLSGVNIAIFFFSYRRTNKIVQAILLVFTVASLLLLASAGYRMFLYVRFYGLSYEKFFASYTVLYCTILYIWLIARSAAKKKIDVIKFLFFLFLWMYALVNIMPVEQIIIRGNTYLAQLDNSRINMYESRILSPDVLSYVVDNGDKHFMKLNHHDDSEVNWSEWITQQKDIVNAKSWYELNLVNLLYKMKY